MLKARKMVANAFTVVSKCRSLDKVQVTKYKSTSTGMLLTIADVNSPIVKGFFVLATEDPTDDGLPHTLEHLVFMGSKRYPFKGVLDLVANRCLASGTNAWTDQDHTCYTLNTAGEEGFIKLLPIYLEHILDPTLAESHYLTEVHHINGEGEDAGVVYSEMQDYESKMSEIVDRAVKQSIYPIGCGYRSETGGRLANLRDSCSHKKVVDFHSKFYCPQNLNVIIAGTVDHQKVIDAIIPVEKYLLDTKKSVCARELSRPFHCDIAPFVHSTEVSLPCPVDDAATGLVQFAWRGPNATDIYEMDAFLVLNEYLTDSAVSPIEKAFIQTAQPLCSQVEGGMEENWVCKLTLKFKGVPADKLNIIRPLMHKTVASVISGDLDMQRMTDIMTQKINRAYSSMERTPHDSVASDVIGDFLYGVTNEDFVTRLNGVTVYERLMKEPKTFWTNLLDKYMSESKPVAVAIGIPDPELAKEFAEKEKERIEKQKVKLGEDGLELCGKKLEAAVDFNESGEPEEELMDRCIVKGLGGVKYVNIQSSTNRCIDEDNNKCASLAGLPFTTILSDCDTNFVQLNLMIDTSSMDVSMRKYITLWTCLLFESAVVRDGKLVPYEEVVKLLNRDLLWHTSGIAFERFAYIELKVAIADYSKGIAWIRDLVSGVNFDGERLLVALNKSLNALPAIKRDGNDVAKYLHAHLTYKTDTNTMLRPLLRQSVFLQSIKDSVDKNPQPVIDELNKLKSLLAKETKNMVLQVICDAKKLPKGGIAALECLNVSGGSGKGEVGVNEPQIVKPVFGASALIPISACESSYFQQSAHAINTLDHADLPAIELCIQYLCQCEGPVWRQVRGQGLAYGAGLTLNAVNGIISMFLYRSSQLIQAYEHMETIVNEHVSGTEEIDEDEWEGARRSLAYQIIEREDEVYSAADHSLKAYFRNVPHDYNRKLCSKMWELSSEEAWKKAGPYLKSVFNKDIVNTAITCHPSKTQEIVDGFNQMGRKITVMSIEDAELTKI